MNCAHPSIISSGASSAVLILKDTRFRHDQTFQSARSTIGGVYMARLYEQGADEVRIGQNAERWWRWVRAGVTLAVALCAS